VEVRSVHIKNFDNKVLGNLMTTECSQKSLHWLFKIFIIIASLNTILPQQAHSNEVTEYFVRVNNAPFSAPYYLFSDTANGSPRSVTLQRGKTYKFTRTDSGTSHPFNIGRAARVADEDLQFSSTSSSASTSYSILKDESITITIPEDFPRNTLTYYCWAHPTSMKLEINVEGPDNTDDSSDEESLVVVEAENYTLVVSGDVTEEDTDDAGGGKHVAQLHDGDVLEYEVDIKSTGNYQLSYRLASLSGSSPGFRLYINDAWVDAAEVPLTGDWQAFQSLQGRIVSLQAGTLKVQFQPQSSNFNINWFSFDLTTNDASNAPTEIAYNHLIKPEDFVGSWRLDGANSAKVGTSQDDGGSWSLGADLLDEFSCVLNDQYIFGSDNMFENSHGAKTRVEAWQGGSDTCETPINPWDGSNEGTYTYDSSAKTITVTGQGNYLGLPGAYNGGERPTAGDAPSSITYTVLQSTPTSMTITIDHSENSDGSNWWTFRLIKGVIEDTDVVDETTTNPNQATWRSFNGATLEGDTFTFPSLADSWAGFENTNSALKPLRFSEGGSITFTASVPSGGDDFVSFTFEKDVYPCNEPQFTTIDEPVSGSAEEPYEIVIESQPIEQTYNSILLKLKKRDQAIIIKNVVIQSDNIAQDNDLQTIDNSSDSSGVLTIEAENYDRSKFTGDVSTEPSCIDGGSHVGYIDESDQLEYDVTIPADGNYRVAYRLASYDGKTAGLKMWVDDIWVDMIDVPKTSDWQRFVTVEGRVLNLTEGTHKVLLDPQTNGFNINWFSMTATSESTSDSPTDQATEPGAENSITAAELEGYWTFDTSSSDGQSITLGPTPQSNEWYEVSDEDEQGGRSCHVDDLFYFGNSSAGGEYRNVMGTQTWLEDTREGGGNFAQADIEGCGTPVAPHDGIHEDSATWLWIEEAQTKQIQISGKGAFIGLPKVHNDGQLTNPQDAVSSITYDIAESTSETMVVEINAGGNYWTYRLKKTTAPQDSGNQQSIGETTGIVYHWKSFSLLENVTVSNVSAAPDAVPSTTTTDTSGRYTLQVMTEGANKKSATKAITANESGNVISSADALAALKIAVGINPNPDPDGSGPLEALPVSPYQYIAADVTSDGRVTSADALAILKMAVKLDTSEPRSWAFVAEDYDFWDESANSGAGSFTTTNSSVVWDSEGSNFDYPQQNKVNLVAILLGDVNGDWSALGGSAKLESDYHSDLVIAQGGSLEQWGIAVESDEAVEDQEINIYVSDIGFSSPYYLFSDSEGGTAKTITLQRGSTYKFIGAGISQSHPFNIGSGWNRVDPNLILTSTSQTDAPIDGVGSIVTGQSMTMTIPPDFAGDSITYYCYAHAGMVSTFSVVGDSQNAASGNAQSTNSVVESQLNDSGESPQESPNSGSLSASCSTVGNDNTSLCQTSFDGLDREFYIYQPDAYALNPDSSVPALISFHGGDGYAQYNMEYTGFNDLADRDNFLAIYPQGTVFGDKGATGWSGGFEDLIDSVDDTAFIEALIGWAGENYRINLERVYAVGFSAGAPMSYNLACALSPKIAGVGAVAGSMSNFTHDNCSPSHSTSVAHIYGLADVASIATDVNSKSPVEVFNFWSNYNNCTATEQTNITDLNGDGVGGIIDSATGCASDTNIQLYKLENFGHEWPSTDSSSEKSGDKSGGGSDIDAGEVIWDFLKQYDINGKIPTTDSQTSLPQNIFSSGSLRYGNAELINNSEINVYYYVPDGINSLTPVLFTFHGQNRNADDYRDAMMTKADDLGFIVVAPEISSSLFPGGDGYNLGNVYIDGDNPSPQTLNPESEWAFSLIEPLFDYMKQQVGNQSPGYSVFGNSAGAQFAHRFMMFKPDARVQSAVISAAGWYTTLNLNMGFPYGLGSSILKDVSFSDFFSRNVTIMVGEDDTNPNASSLRHNTRVDQQGLNRLTRAQYFYDGAKTKATQDNEIFNWDFLINPNMDHDFRLASTKAADILF